jgi:CheY-like chemotaxis protein
VDASPSAQWKMPVAPRPATILLVDDEDVVRAATAEMLEDVGYTVLQADSGPAALAMLRNAEPIDLLVTDYLMPGMNGVELIRNARNLEPSLPALIISGYSTIAEGPGADLPRLAKPFRQIDLAGRIAEILSSQDATTLKFPDKRERDRRSG